MKNAKSRIFHINIVHAYQTQGFFKFYRSMIKQRFCRICLLSPLFLCVSVLSLNTHMHPRVHHISLLSDHTLKYISWPRGCFFPLEEKGWLVCSGFLIGILRFYREAANPQFTSTVVIISELIIYRAEIIICYAISQTQNCIKDSNFPIVNFI